MVNKIGSGMPQMGAAFAGWMESITLKKRTESVVDGFNKITYNNITFQGTVQPLSPKLLLLKPEGQRAWTWLQVHCFASAVNLNDGDVVVFNGDTYKIMGLLNYSLNNYIEYHLVKDYQKGTSA